MMIRRLDPSSDRALVDAFFQEAADYIAIERGEGPGPEVTDEFFTDAPPGCDPAASLRLGLFDGVRLIALAEASPGKDGSIIAAFCCNFEMGSQRLRCKTWRDLRVQPTAFLNNRLPLGIGGVRCGFDIVQYRRYARIGPCKNRLPLIAGLGREHILEHFMLLGPCRHIVLMPKGFLINGQTLHHCGEELRFNAAHSHEFAV